MSARPPSSSGTLRAMDMKSSWSHRQCPCQEGRDRNPGSRREPGSVTPEEPCWSDRQTLEHGKTSAGSENVPGETLTAPRTRTRGSDVFRNLTPSSHRAGGTRGLSSYGNL